MADGFRVHLLRFKAEVTAPLRLPPAAGAALRGALFGALRQQFCLAGQSPECGRPDLAESCQVCFLLAPVDPAERRGRDVPRPYVLRAPTSGPSGTSRSPGFAPGQSLEFGLATFGRALQQFPYALLGVEEMGRRGIGVGRQGQFRLDEVWVEHPILGRQEAIYRRARDGTVRAPNLPIEAVHVKEEAEVLADRGGARRLRLTLLTPTRLIERDRLVKQDTFELGPLMARLLERLRALFARYGEASAPASLDGTPPPFEAPALLRAAQEVRIVERRLAWRELFRASGRHGRMLPMGGLVGEVTLEGDLRPFLPWLVWGGLVHVGKDAAMGNGQYKLEALP